MQVDHEDHAHRITHVPCIKCTSLLRSSTRLAATWTSAKEWEWADLSIVKQPCGYLGPPRHIWSQPLHFEALPSDWLEGGLELILVLTRHRPLQRLHCSEYWLINFTAVCARHSEQVGWLGILLAPVGEDVVVVPASLGRRVGLVAETTPSQLVHLLVRHFLEDYVSQHLVAQLIGRDQRAEARGG
eukprot:scaffold267655_cov31-Tisochrysis_lutea.AAC.1